MLRLYRLLILLLLLPLSAVAAERLPIAQSLDGKLIAGYQGWFGCPHDHGRDHDRGWSHWFLHGTQAHQLTVDMLPATREFADSDLCDTGLPRADGRGTVKIFSSLQPRVVARHFQWMREYGIDGAALQRFVSELADPVLRERRDQVLRHVRAAAEAEQRLFYLSYDITGTPEAEVIDAIRRDWQQLNARLRLTDSPAYLHHAGKPVLQLWGFGFADRPGQPAAVRALIDELKAGRAGVPAAYVMGGVPSQWRHLRSDAKPERAWAEVYQTYDALSPWTVGRYADDRGAERFWRRQAHPDLRATRQRGQRYMPVVFPGFSWANLMRNRGQLDQARFNQIGRACGRFYWRQLQLALDARVTTIYIAMFDEVDESTAIFKTETDPARLPAGARMLTPQQDGCALPDDWYLRISGRAAHHLHTRTRAPSDLDDAMATGRPSP